jgi:hypothetical protein
MVRVVLASAAAIALAAGTARAEGPEEGPGTGDPGWRAATGLRVEQWMAPRSGGMGLDVRLTLPEMEHAGFAVETFSWERLDVMQEDLDPDAGTVYQVLGVRRWFGSARAGVFAGAHVMTYADGPRGFTPWFGFRLGRAQGGPLLAAEVRLLGMGVIGWRGGGIQSGELGIRATGPSLGRFRLGGRGRLRSVNDVQRDATISAGIETIWRGRPLFLGLGIETLERTPPESPDPELMMMETADSAPRPTSALMVQLEVDMDLPRSIAE